MEGKVASNVFSFMVIELKLEEECSVFHSSFLQAGFKDSFPCEILPVVTERYYYLQIKDRMTYL